MKNGKKCSFGLLPRIVVAIGLGIGAGFICPGWFARIAMTFNSIFSEFLGFCIPLIILGFVAPAIADIGGKAAKMLVFTAALAYFATIVAGLLSYLTGSLCFPKLIEPVDYIHSVTSSEGIAPYFTVAMPPLMSVMSALVLAFVLGVGVSRLNTVALKNVLEDLRDVISIVINRAIVPLLPFYIFSIFLNMTMEGQVGPILMTFVKIIAVIFALHVFVLVFQYCVASLFARGGNRNPFRLLWTMMPAYFTALGTQSSAATIPVTLERSIKTGVDKDVAGFVIPLCATIHMSGSTLKIVACALALMITSGMHYDFAMFSGFIAMLGITIIAAPGVPGGAIMASLGLLSSMLGFSEADNALMIALYISMDSFGTACNVTGDGALAIIVNRFFGKKEATPVGAA
ncbi:MAG: dicarboxylate/amino acid:cation symporter [Muribaculaceae bacterium]|nr:dicarboxylate/amino acid:cation symporter [Muribaculaceae bacterium]